jgi:hypothetical protein
LFFVKEEFCGVSGSSGMTKVTFVVLVPGSTGKTGGGYLGEGIIICGGTVSKYLGDSCEIFTPNVIWGGGFGSY